MEGLLAMELRREWAPLAKPWKMFGRGGRMAVRREDGSREHIQL